MPNENDSWCDGCGKETNELRGVTAPWGGSDLCRRCERLYKRMRPHTMNDLQTAVDENDDTSCLKGA